jgi:hypothetical protein
MLDTGAYDTSEPFNVEARYWKPWIAHGNPVPPSPAGDIIFTLVPEGIDDTQILRDALSYIYSQKTDDEVGVPEDKVKVRKSHPTGNVIVSHDLFGLWSLSINKPILWDSATKPWQLAFPPFDNIKSFHRKFFGDLGADDLYVYRWTSEQSTVTARKITTASGKKRQKTQQAVMNGVSATLVSKDHKAHKPILLSTDRCSIGSRENFKLFRSIQTTTA